VISYVKQNHRLPEYYITKNEARKQGWNPSKGNLCDVLPGKAIGGDKFGNREGRLPDGEKYFEADVNYHCGSRKADRIIFTENGDVYLTKNHYKSFENSNVTAGNETSYHGLRISYFKNDIRTLKINALFIFHQFSYWPYHVQKKINM
jgi:hypothetical protein